MTEEPIIEIGASASLEIPSGSNLGNIQKDFDRLEKNQEKANTFMMWITGIITSVFFVTGALIALDYFKNNEERYEKFIDETKEVRKDFYSKKESGQVFINKSDFYSKEQIQSMMQENDRNSQVLNCFKIKGRFSIECFNQ